MERDVSIVTVWPLVKKITMFICTTDGTIGIVINTKKKNSGRISSIIPNR
jgi:hypothetical protein